MAPKIGRDECRVANRPEDHARSLAGDMDAALGRKLRPTEQKRIAFAFTMPLAFFEMS